MCSDTWVCRRVRVGFFRSHGGKSAPAPRQPMLPSAPAFAASGPVCAKRCVHACRRLWAGLRRMRANGPTDRPPAPRQGAGRAGGTRCQMWRSSEPPRARPAVRISAPLRARRWARFQTGLQPCTCSGRPGRCRMAAARWPARQAARAACSQGTLGLRIAASSCLQGLPTASCRERGCRSWHVAHALGSMLQGPGFVSALGAASREVKRSEDEPREGQPAALPGGAPCACGRLALAGAAGLAGKGTLRRVSSVMLAGPRRGGARAGCVRRVRDRRTSAAGVREFRRPGWHGAGGPGRVCAALWGGPGGPSACGCMRGAAGRAATCGTRL